MGGCELLEPMVVNRNPCTRALLGETFSETHKGAHKNKLGEAQRVVFRGEPQITARGPKAVNPSKD